MENYSQTNEQFHILEYFKDFTGTLYDIGANDGKTFSNSLALIELGWKAVCIEPSSIFTKLKDQHYDNPNVYCLKYALSDKTGEIEFNEGTDTLLSSLSFDKGREQRWSYYSTFFPTKVNAITWKDLLEYNKEHNIPTEFDFINIDAEEMDWIILQQIDLSNVKMLCIEFGSNLDKILKYCEGMKIIDQNTENVILVK